MFELESVERLGVSWEQLTVLFQFDRSVLYHLLELLTFQGEIHD